MLKYLCGGVHVFTARPNLVVAALSREAETNRRRQELSRHLAPHATVVQYPNVVSFFYDEFYLSCDYMATSVSSRTKSPVLVSVVGRKTGLPGREEQICQLYWAFGKNDLAEIELVSSGGQIRATSCGTEQLKEKLGQIAPQNSILYQPLENTLALDLVAALEKELGILLGREGLSTILTHCKLVKNHPFASFYEYESAGTAGR